MTQWWQRHAPATFPTHTLTFVFADLRDYTAFVERHGDAAGAGLIADYRRLVRHEVAGTGGGEVKTEGDSFFVVFATARQALHCAVGILREAERMSAERPERPIRIGVGVHAGEPVPQEGQFVGSAVNIAARLAQHAAAGELLVSEVVRGLLRTSGLPEMEEREGLVLKGVEDPPRVYRVLWQRASENVLVAPTEGRRRAREVALGPVRLSPVAALAAGAVVLAGLAGAGYVLTRAPEPPRATLFESAPPTARGTAFAGLREKAGDLIWQAALDAAGSDIEPRFVVGDPDGSDVRVRPGELELVIQRSGASTGTGFKKSVPKTFLAEMDIRVRPGSDVRFLWSMRRGEREQHEVRLETQSEEIWISYVNVGVRSDRISARPTLPGVRSGKVVTLSVVADGTGYALYADGKKVTEASDVRLADLETPFGISVAGRQGSVTVVGLRVFALAGSR